MWVPWREVLFIGGLKFGWDGRKPCGLAARLKKYYQQWGGVLAGHEPRWVHGVFLGDTVGMLIRRENYSLILSGGLKWGWMVENPADWPQG